MAGRHWGTYDAVKALWGTYDAPTLDRESALTYDGAGFVPTATMEGDE